MTFDEAVARAAAALKQPLPGAAAHALMAPRPRRNWPPGFSIERIRHAAGLLLVFPIDGRPHLVLTVRAPTLDRHGGQVSLPGGVIEPGETFEEAARREAEEEIGLASTDANVRTEGGLSPIDIPVSGFRLHPVLAVAGSRPVLTPSDFEVERIIQPSIEQLLDPRRIVWRKSTREAGTLDFPAFLVDDAEIWGATAMVLAEFLSLLGWNGPDLSRS